MVNPVNFRFIGTLHRAASGGGGAQRRRGGLAGAAGVAGAERDQVERAAEIAAMEEAPRMLA